MPKKAVHLTKDIIFTEFKLYRCIDIHVQIDISATLHKLLSIGLHSFTHASLHIHICAH